MKSVDFAFFYFEICKCTFCLNDLVYSAAFLAPVMFALVGFEM